ncbi:uncharacterized protein PV07_01203 [Cladophialophora immunda]|uniref:Uncharacterized protein n=1 Tax=Cladophialophora immunda TaxID=569365 RepID=A0A0D2CX49_9EURO|nr:uncharacterized protein PV07_01203 [Cladophialophora immunda]KIW34425.1 hypothetical protein PV07_01203 [Cladophialophora immunda]
MRLINTTTLGLEEFEGSDIPLYAILSHTWGEGEVTYQDVQARKAKGKLGYEKIKNTCKRARADGFDYVWVDTCCIDKKSSAELSEAINSMCSWYRDAIVCYAFLADVSSNFSGGQIMVDDFEFSDSRWFTRGWTLQELIVPQILIFLDRNWQEIGTKASLQRKISAITDIPANILEGDIDSASVAQKMSWASWRETKRVEDQAYCLLGLFGIHMPLLYGEGKKAFRRLQEEILRVSDDYSIFAWENNSRATEGLLATTPYQFQDSMDVKAMDQSTTSGGAVTVDNKGIHLTLRISKHAVRDEDHFALLPCTRGGRQIGIYLRPIPETKDMFTRNMVKESIFPLTDHSNLRDYLERSLCVRQSRTEQINTPHLHAAAAVGHRALVNFLTSKGMGLESRDQHGRTALFLASENGHLEVVRLLLDKGANPNARSKSGATPLDLAQIGPHEPVVEQLLEKGAVRRVP